MRAYVRLVGLPVFWKSWGALEQVVRSGKPAVTDIFAYFKGHPQETEIFNAGMKSKAQSVISPVLAAYDFSIFGTIGDIGGGLGHLLQAVLKSAPKLRGVLFDQPHVVERSEEHTSELQSPCNLVCRLLLEKKKEKIKYVLSVQY